MIFEADFLSLQRDAWKQRKPIDAGGVLKFIYGKEYHAFNPDVIHALHDAVNSGDYEAYKKYAALVNTRPVATLRDLLRLRDDVTAISVDDVEPIENILPRFDFRRHVAGCVVTGSPRGHRHRDEPSRRPLQLWRGR